MFMDQRRAPRLSLLVVIVACLTSLLVAGFSSTATASSQVAKTPPMGWNSWYTFEYDVSEDLLKETADALVKTGLRDAGYEYVLIDSGWARSERGAGGRLVPDPEKFPSGMKALADYLHSRGLKLGIYAAIWGCGYDHDISHAQTDANSFAEWGVDYVKVDNCGEHKPFAETQEGYAARYSVIRDAFRATGRDMVYSIAEWGVSSPWEWGAGVANLWRTTPDLGNTWATIKRVVEQNAPLDRYAGPGAWNDPDILRIGVEGVPGLEVPTETEYKTSFSLWAIMAAPLIIGADVRDASPQTMEILRNEDLIAVNQDRRGIQGRVIQKAGTTMQGNLRRAVPEVFAKPLANGDVAVGLYNATEVARTIETTAARAGLRGARRYRLKDLWTGAESETAGKISARVPAHATAVYRVTAGGSRGDQLPPATTLSVTARHQPDRTSPAVVKAGERLDVATTLRNAGSTSIGHVRVTAQAPTGWSARPQGFRARGRVPGGGRLTSNWTLRAPPRVSPGTYKLRVAGSYRGPAGSWLKVREALRLEVIDPPPAGTTALSDLAWFRADSYWAPIGKNANVLRRADPGNPANLVPLKLEGVEYPKGLGVNAPTSIKYYLGERCTQLTVDVGIHEQADRGLLWDWLYTGGHVIFRIKADGKTVAKTTTKTASDLMAQAFGYQTGASRLSANLRGATWLELEADDGGDNSTPGVIADHGYQWNMAQWAAPELTCR